MAEDQPVVSCPKCGGGFRANTFTHCPHCGAELPEEIAKKEEKKEEQQEESA